MIAYKFLADGGVGPFSGFRWPTGAPGPWVESVPDACMSGIHACSVEDLPYWLHHELWQVELDDPLPMPKKLVARRGRLLRRVERWDAAAKRAFASNCAARARALAAARGGADATLHEYVADAEMLAREGQVPATALVTARVAELLDGPTAYEQERLRQSRWLREHLELG